MNWSGVTGAKTLIPKRIRRARPRMRRHIQWAILVSCLFVSTTVWAQAWTPYAGDMGFSISYGYFTGGDHLFSSDAVDGQVSRGYVAHGDRWFLGNSEAHSIAGTLEYGITDRLAVQGAATYMITRYNGNDPLTALDDGDYHDTLQDAAFDIRYNILRGRVWVTPELGFGFPIQHYGTEGHSGFGRALDEIHAGIYTGYDLAPWIDRASVEAGYIYSGLENVGNQNLAGGLLTLSLGYAASSRLFVRTAFQYSDTYGGTDWICASQDTVIPHGGCPGAELSNQSADSAYTRLGGTLGYRVFGSMIVSAGFATTLDGKNLEDGNFYSAGISYALSTR